MSVNKRRVFVFGDSHVGAFALYANDLNIPMIQGGRALGAYLFPFIPCHFHGATAHNLISLKSKSDSDTLWSLNLSAVSKERDLIMLWFGEIDCRYHIKDVEMIDQTIENYMEKIQELEDEGYTFVVMSNPPANKDGGTTPIGDRPKIYAKFFEKLKEECEKRNYKMLDMYTFALGEDGYMKRELMRDDTHFKPDAIYKYVVERLMEDFYISFRFYGG